MKSIILTLWGALIASGWWAVAVFGFPSETKPDMVFVALPTTILSIVWGCFCVIKITDNWNEEER